MIEIKTSNWPTTLWFEVVKWCSEVFGAEEFGKTWFYQDDYSLYMTEECATLVVLRFS